MIKTSRNATKSYERERESVCVLEQLDIQKSKMFENKNMARSVKEQMSSSSVFDLHGVKMKKAVSNL